MSCNWQNVTKYLDCNPATRDTTNDKLRGKGRAILKIPYTFIIPATIIDVAAIGAQQAGCLVHQYNFTAPYDFRILSHASAAITDRLTYGFMTIRHRVGGVVTRYRLPWSGDAGLEAIFAQYPYIVQAPNYTNQEVKANFAVEIWTVPPGQLTIDVKECKVTTGLLKLPDDSTELEEDIPYVENLDRAALDSTFPEALPTVYGASSSWLTN